MQMVTERRQERLLHKTDFMSRAVSRDRETFVLCCFYNILPFILFLAVLGLCCFAHAFSGCSRGYSLLCCMGFSFQCYLLLQSTGSRHPGSVVVEHRLSCSEAMRNLPGPGIEPVSPALADRFFTTEPLGKA